VVGGAAQLSVNCPQSGQNGSGAVPMPRRLTWPMYSGQARVRIDAEVHYLGPHGSPESCARDSRYAAGGCECGSASCGRERLQRGPVPGSSAPPGDAALRGDPLEVTHEQHLEVPPRRHPGRPP
jgi:hypothetical protein